LSYGMVGMHGMGYTNVAAGDADLIIGIGMRFDDRATCKVDTFAPHARIIHIDIDPAEISKNVPANVPIVGDVKNVLIPLNKLVKPTQHMEWLHHLEGLRKEHPSLDIRETDKLLPQYIIREIYEATKGSAIITTGVGQHQMWAAHYYYYDKPNSFITSGGLGTMGFGLPSAVGAKIGCPDATVWCIDGDGSFQMTLCELGTIAQENCAVKIAILNNGYLGLVRQWQELFYKENYSNSAISGPDFAKIAQAYGIPALTVTRREEIKGAVAQAMAYPGPFLIDFRIDPSENVYPLVPPGASLEEQIESPKAENVGQSDAASGF